MPPVDEMIDHIAKALAIANSLQGTVAETATVASWLDEALVHARKFCWAVETTEEDRQDMRDEKRAER